MHVFDSHIHIFPDAIAAGAIASLSARSAIPAHTDGTRAGLQRSMQQAGIAGALNCPIATKVEQVEAVNRWAAVNNQWPIMSLGTIHPEHRQCDQALAQLQASGLKGIKLHPEYQNFDPLEPRMRPIWQACSELGLIVVMHAGADIGFAPPYHSDPKRIRDLLEKFPRLRLVAAHTGGWKMWEEVVTDLVGASIYFDLAFSLGIIPEKLLAAIISAHGSEHILFATDSPWCDQKQNLETFAQLQLPPEQAQQILWSNAINLFGLQAYA